MDPFGNKKNVIIMAIDFNSNLTYADLLLAYRITMFSIWGIGIDIPRLLVRYAKSYPSIINFHSMAMTICGLLTMMYVIARTALYLPDAKQTGVYMGRAEKGEFVISWILVGLLLVQMVLGFKVRYEMVSQKLSIDMFTIKIVHRWLGIAMSLLGKIGVALSLYPLNSNNSLLFRSWMFILGALLLIFVIFQFVYRIQSRSLMLKFPLRHKSKFHRLHLEILQNINRGVEDFRDYKQLGVRYIILDNTMYYIDENFIHPGGEYIFSMYNGQQINYLFRGTHQLNPDFPRHRHTKYAINYLEQRLVGKIDVENLLHNFTSESQELVQWSITALNKMDGDSYMVEFQAKDGYLKQNLNIENFGKYMMLSCPSEQVIDKVQRPYSIIISQTDYQCRILHRFKEAYKNYYSESSSRSLDKKEQDVFSDKKSSQLVFCIKEYKSGVFTRFMFSSWAEKKFSIMGPYGRGLRLRPGTKGFYIIIAAGTGILPFIDLFQYLLQRTLLRLVAARAGEVAVRKLNEQRANYDELAGTKILFVGSFQSRKQFYLEHIPKDLYHLNQKHQLEQFDMMLRYNNSETEPGIRMTNDTFDTRFIRSLVDMEPDRIYYCGPPSIEHTIRKVEAEVKKPNTFFYI